MNRFQYKTVTNTVMILSLVSVRELRAVVWS